MKRDAEAAANEDDRGELTALAPEQERLAREVADLDVPEAGEERREAIERAAEAIADLERNRAADVPASQRNLDAALDDLERRSRLADEW